MKQRALMLFGHPDVNSETETFCGQLASHYQRGYEAAGHSLRRINLAELTFDPILRTGFREQQPLEPDLLEVKAAIEAATHVVWVFPMHWASPSTLVRGLFDRLFLPGWAFKYEQGGNPLPKGLLKGRSCRVVLTMDSPWLWYTLVNHRCVHRSFGGASLRFCGFSPVKFTTVHNVRGLSAPARSKWCDKLVRVGATDAAVAPR